MLIQNRYLVTGVLMLATLVLVQLSAQELPPPAEKQVVLETSCGEIVLEVFPQAAPNHVAKFLDRVNSGFYDGTSFHRAIPLAIIQGGDPLSRDPAKRPQYGTGGLGEIKKEASPLSHVRGTLSAVLIPGNPDSAGSQFFICVTDQVQLDGQYTAYGRVVEGTAVLEKISQAPTDAMQLLTERIELKRAYSRDRPPPEVIPFVDTSVSELEKYSAIIHTSLGDIRLGFYPQDAPEHVRQFLRLARLGLYDGTTFHRVVPEFVLQGGLMDTRTPPVPDKYRPVLKPLKAEFSQRPHVRGVLSMARRDDPDSGMDSFFIVLDTQPHLDGQYTAFGYVEAGIEVVDAIVARPVSGESPIEPLTLKVEVREK